VHALAPELELEAGDTEQRAGGRADLGREIREGRDVIARPRGLRGELLARDLHAVAGVAGKPDHGARERASRLLRYLCGRCGFAHRSSVLSFSLTVRTALARSVFQPASTSVGCFSTSPGRKFNTASGKRSAIHLMKWFTVTTPTGRPSASTSGIVRCPATLIRLTA